MSVEFVKGVVYYDKGFVPSVEEVEEILYFYKQSYRTDLSDIISDYYGY